VNDTLDIIQGLEAKSHISQARPTCFFRWNGKKGRTYSVGTGINIPFQFTNNPSIEACNTV